MSRILRFFVCLGTLFFAGNALAAGYTCSSLPKYLSCQHGYYMTSSQSSTTYNGTPRVGNYCQPCSRKGSNYTCAGGTAAPVQSAGGYSCPTYKRYTSCSAGYYMTNSSTSKVPDGSSKPGNACRPCSVYGANYTCAGGTAAPQAITVNVTCQAGQYLPKGATSCTTCPAGSYCPGQTCSGVSLVSGATSACGLTTCPGGYSNSAAGSSNINDCYLTLRDGEMVDVVNMGSQLCNEGYYCNHDGQKIYYDSNNEERGLTDSRPTVGGYEACARGSYAADYEATACDPCTNGKTTSGTGSTSCDVTCSNSENVATWVTPEWTPNYVSNSCKVASCVACTKGTGVASCTASTDRNACIYTATCASGYKNPTCNGSSCSCELDSVTCSAGQYLPAGATSCATCPKGHKCPSSSKTYTVSTTADQGNTPCAGSTEYQDATGQTSCKTPSDGYYKKDNTSQQVCGTGYFCKSGARTACTTYGTGYTTDTTTASVNTQCYLNVAGGKVRNGTTGTTLNTCGAGKYKVAHKAYYGTSYSCDSCPAAESGWTMGTDTGLTNYTACYETKAATSISNYCSAGQLKKNATSTTAWGTATISTAFQATSGSIVKGQTCTQCIGATWSSGGTATSCSACPSGYTANTTPGKSAETQCQIVVDGGKYIAAAKATTPTNCPMDTYKAEHYVNYGSTSSCTRCPTGYGVTGGYGISESSCYISVGAGKYLGTAKGTTFSTCAAGTYKTAHNVYYGSISSCDACRGRTKYSSAGASSCSTVSSGYYTTGCNSSNNSCTGQSQCTGATYCASGVQNNCPGSYTANTTAGKTAASQCQISVSKGHYIGTANSSTASSCAAGTYKAAHNVNYGSTSSCSSCPTGYTASAGTAGVEGECYISVGAGKYLGTAKGTTLSTCAAGTFKVAHTVNYGGTSSCGVCGDNLYSDAGAASCTGCKTANGYTNSGTTAASHAGEASCKATCAAGTYVATAGTACTTVGTGYWGAGGTVSQNTTLGRTQCPANYRNGAAASAESGCQTSCAAGTYVATAKAACTTVGTGYYRATHNVNYGSTSTRTQCPENYRSGAATGAESSCQTSCAAGTYVATANAACTSVGTGYYRASHNVNYGSTSTRTQCPANYRNGAAAGSESGCQTSCAAGTYVAAANAACTSVGTGYYRASHNVNYGSTSTRTQCPAGYRDGAAAAAENGCTMNVAGGKYLGTAKGTTLSNCAAGTFKAAHTVNYGGTSSCEVCSNNQYSDAGAASCTGCKTANGYTNSGTTAASHAGEASCKATCAAGTYVATAGSACTTVGTGYWGAGGTVSQNTTLGRNQCPEKYRDGAAATQKSDCAVQTTAGKYIAAPEATEQTKCPAKNYCPSESVKYGATNSPTACPTADATTARTTYPDDYLNPTRLSISNQGWSTGLPAITSCSANYTFTNAAGNFTVESVEFNETSGKYEVGGGKYYTFVNAGWYLVDKYSETYCNEPTNRMLYHNVAECPANSYCPGYNSMPLCSTGTHNDEMGKYPCSDLGNGYNYSPAKSGAATACYLTTTAGKFVKIAKSAEVTCESPYYCPGGVKVNYGSVGGNSNCSDLTGVSVSGGTYTSAAGSSANTACKYTAPSKTITGCKTVTTNTVTYSGTAWPATTYGVTANGGYIISGNNTAAATCSQCSGAVWSAGGTATSCSACPAQTSGWTRNSGTGWTAVTQCNQTQNVGGNCRAGVLKQNATSTTAWGTTTISTPLQAKPGSIVNGQKCDQCSGAVWSAGGTATSCSACPAQTSGWTRNSGTGWTAVTQCNQTQNVGGNCRAGVLKQNATSTTAWGTTTISTPLQAKPGSIVNGQKCDQCSGAVWSAGGTATSCSACPAQTSGWTRNSGTGWTAVTQCNQTQNVGGNCRAGVLKQNATSTTAWGTTTISTPLQAKPGSIVNGQKCDQCSGAVWSAGGTATSCSACPAQTSGWTRNSGTGWTAVTQCNQTQNVGGNCRAGVLKQNATSTTAWGASTISTPLQANPGSIVNGQKCDACNPGTYSAGGTATSCNACANWTYAASTGMSSCTACPALTSGWAKADSTGTGWKSHTSCVQISPKPANCAGGNLKQVAASNGATIWGASTVNSALSSEPGYYINDTACSPCTGATYYGGGTATSCTPCPSIYTSNTTAAKSKAEQCTVQTTGGYYIKAAKDSTQTECDGGYYCPSTTVAYGSYNTQTACPVPADHKRATIPAEYYTNSIANTYIAMSGRKSAITECQALNTYEGARGSLYDYVTYNTTTQKYDVQGSVLWFKANPGYYLTTATGCGTYAYYGVAKECDKNAYCPGKDKVECNSSNQATVQVEKFGLELCSALGNGKYATSDGGAAANSTAACYLTTSNSKFVAAAGAAEGICTAGGWCPGGVRVNYGSTGGRNTCPTKYPSSAASSNSELDCYVTTAAGKYVATVGAGQVNCAGTGYYCPGGTNVYSGAYGSRLTTGGRNQCPAGYRDLVATASTTKEAQCTMNVAGGKYVATAKESAASGTCAAGYAKAAHSVTYGNTSSCAACTGTTYAENTGQASCTACPTQSGVTNISYWISTGTHTDANGCYGFYNNVALDNGSAARIQCFWDKTKSQYDTSCGAMKDGLKCNAAYYNAALESSPTNNAAYYTDKASVIAKACTSVGKGYWSPADVYTRTQCPAGYRDGAAGVSEAQCTMNVAGGKYVAKANESAASGTCAAGYAKAAHSVTYGNTSSCAACTGATYAASTGQASCTTCPTAKTYASAVKSYGYWNGGKDGDHTISDGCYATMTGTLSNGSLTEHGCYLGTDGDYGNGGGKRCYVHQGNLKCNAGYYASTLSNGYVWNNTRAGLLGNTCVGVGAGYYSAANILTRNQCPTGLTTIGYGAGADEVTDCGRILHFGDDKLYLRSGKKTTPSLNVKIGDTTYYGNMTAGTGKGKLRLKSGTTTYSVHDDSM